MPVVTVGRSLWGKRIDTEKSMSFGPIRRSRTSSPTSLKRGRRYVATVSARSSRLNPTTICRCDPYGTVGVVDDKDADTEPFEMPVARAPLARAHRVVASAWPISPLRNRSPSAGAPTHA